MRTLLIGIALLSLSLAPFHIGSCIMSKYKMEQKYLQEWHLADKSSTLQAKQEHIDKFVKSLEKGYEAKDFSTHNAVFLKTANNEFTANLNALKSLQDRLKAVEKMDPNSFEYNTAIQQITAQEQGEATEMIEVFTGCFKLASYPMAWKWIEVVVLCIWLMIGLGGLFSLFLFWNELE